MTRAPLLNLLLPFVALAVIALIIVLPQLHGRAADASSGSISAIRSAMESSIRQEGAAAAYAAFKKQYAGDPSFAHNAAHIFGESLYRTLGLNGLSTCDSTFAFGCYHGFLTAAISSEGLTVIPKLDAVCAKNFGAMGSACQHGIGHGILEYLGHDHLAQALTACGMTNQPDPLAGCTSGVFMEYNVPIATLPDGTIITQARALADPGKPYDPCPSVDTEAHKESCYHELPQWWRQVYGSDFSKIGALCARAGAPDLAAACYDGVGAIVPDTAGYDVAKAKSLCAAMPDALGRSLCVLTAASSFSVDVDSAGKGEAMCAGEDLRGHECPV